MIWPQSALRRAAQFAAAVEGRQTPGTLDADTAALVQLARRLHEVDSPEMRPEFAADLRVRLLDAAPDALASAEPNGPRPASTTPPPRKVATRRSRLGIAAVGVTVLATFVGVGFASNSALPGDPLYPIKRTLENVELATAGSAADRGEQLLNQATTRLSEVQTLVDEHSSDPAVAVLMGGTLGDFSTQAHDGGDELMTAYTNDQDSHAIVQLRDFTSASADKLEGMAPQLPAAVLNDVAGAASELTTLDSTALAACPTCSSLAPLSLPANLQSLVSAVKDGRTPTLPDSPQAPTPGSSTIAELTAPMSVLGSSGAPPVIVPTAPATSLPPTTDPEAPTSQQPTTDPTSSPPSSAPTTSDTPTSGEPTSGPPTSGDPTSGPPTSGDPTSGPPTTSPGSTDPVTSAPGTSVPPSSQEPTTEPSTSVEGPSTSIDDPSTLPTTGDSISSSG